MSPYTDTADYLSNSDVTTKAMWLAVKACTTATMILLPVKFIVHLPLALIFPLIAGPLLLAFSFLWMPVYGLLLGTSWLWLKCWPLRPMVAVPGLIFSIAGDTLLMFAPPPRDPDDIAARLIQADFADEWPLSWLIFKGDIQSGRGTAP